VGEKKGVEQEREKGKKEKKIKDSINQMRRVR
jgi:hypothetical protein